MPRVYTYITCCCTRRRKDPSATCRKPPRCRSDLAVGFFISKEQCKQSDRGEGKGEKEERKKSPRYRPHATHRSPYRLHVSHVGKNSLTYRTCWYAERNKKGNIGPRPGHHQAEGPAEVAQAGFTRLACVASVWLVCPAHTPLRRHADMSTNERHVRRNPKKEADVRLSRRRLTLVKGHRHFGER